jgi:hypothetical protein
MICSHVMELGELMMEQAASYLLACLRGTVPEYLTLHVPIPMGAS